MSSMRWKGFFFLVVVRSKDGCLLSRQKLSLDGINRMLHIRRAFFFPQKRPIGSPPKKNLHLNSCSEEFVCGTFNNREMEKTEVNFVIFIRGGASEVSLDMSFEKKQLF